ncbi:MAG: ATP-grasp domain-containing protein [Methylovulum sp.]|nr:ATP-grasp domain-containing protein [Methylovulum sp.]
MKILLFEYICGGGFNRQALPDSLAREGGLMLQALLADFASLPAIELTVMLDSRLLARFDTAAVQVAVVTPEQDVDAEFARLVATADAVWPIAPESGHILHKLCLAVQAQGKNLLTSPAAAVALTGDKYQTYLRLLEYHIPTVPTQLADRADCPAGEWMVKPIDGAGCGDSFVVSLPDADPQPFPRSASLIVQPHLQGDKTSLSCLFRHGKCWLLSVNLQHFNRVGRHYELSGITVNCRPVNDVYQALADQVAAAFPQLWGTAGIDLIEDGGAVLVLEINPRLTTSFTGLQAALGLNIAEQVLCLRQGLPLPVATLDRPVLLGVQ